MARVFLVIAAAYGFVAVALGAFAAHGLQDRMEERALEVMEIGVRYQMTHALALLAVSLLLLREPSAWLTASGWSFTVGVIFFSGALYLLASTGIGRFGAVAPIGGILFLAGWVLLAIGGWTLMTIPEG
ncbi:MAG: DUF423 domain-containing protein [Gemmatimonadales bacterium]|nr:MAG: DUF423 domain-containing protein [Gemmatimonadales bacterium]